jgi:DNA-binding GntR family transcriptional regulator
VRLDDATDRIGVRLVTTGEARLLEVPRREVVLTLLVTAYNGAGTPLLAADAVMPTTRAELEGTSPSTRVGVSACRQL